MPHPRWDRAKQVFHEALDKRGPERTRHVAAACADDAALRAQVEALLTAHDEAGAFMASPTEMEHEVAHAIARLAADIPSEAPGTRVGPYKLLQVIGEGGFGIVYMAEQEHPIRRRVALKIIKLGMDTKEVIARFESERQALALMDHPNIAKVLDAGATDTGRPYFVMELVKGVPLTDYCDANHLTTRERLDLFADVCKAIHHAHERGIIHRDIKPSNVMVTLHDGTPVPKIIDFGVAKATNQRLTEKTLFTAYGEFVGTPAYMSPEQTEFSGLEVDRRSDVYSLGVLLYELLTGTTPFEAESLRARGFLEVMRIIREEDPPTPSARVHTLGSRLIEVADQRQVDPGSLEKLIRGDLDWVVMKALEKDRRRRYDSAAALVDDLGRYFRDEPVIARRPSAVYRLSKFARRRRATLLAGAGVVVAIVLGVALAQIARLGRDSTASGSAAAPSPGATTVGTQRLWEGQEIFPDLSSVSPDGRYLSFADIYADNSTGNLSLRDLVSGETRPLTGKHSWNESKEFADRNAFSRDGKHIAYTWQTVKGGELRVVGVDGGASRLVFARDDVFVRPTDWSPDNRRILAILYTKRGTQLALISAVDGSATVLKEFDWRSPEHSCFVDRGRYVAYDVPSSEKEPETEGRTARDVHLVAIDGAHDTDVVQNVSDDRLLGCSPDGRQILFLSDRTGSYDAWLLDVDNGAAVGNPRRVKSSLGEGTIPIGFLDSGRYIYGQYTTWQDVYTTERDPVTGKVAASVRLVAESGKFVGSNLVPEWSSDGRFLAYLSFRHVGDAVPSASPPRLIIRSMESGAERALPANLYYVHRRLRWSPDGSHLVVSGWEYGWQYGIFLINAQTGEVQRIARGTQVLRYPVWSPQGGAVFYVKGDAAIVRRDLSRHEETPLYQVPLDEWRPHIRGLEISPDGRSLAFCLQQQDPSPGASNTVSSVVIIPAEGGESRTVLQVKGIVLSWTPDGQAILVQKSRTAGAGSTLWTVPVSGAAPEQLLLGRNILFQLRFRPDGRGVTFDSGEFKTEIWSLENILQPLASPR